MAVDADRFRDAVARFASGVAVVTTRGAEGLHGLTVSSFCALSLAPPLVLVCLDRLAQSAELLAASRVFGVSILSGPQQFLADRFAGRGPLVNRRFDGVPYFTAHTGAPLLRGSLAWLDCTLAAEYPGGDHVIFVGQVEAAGTEPAPTALVYWNRGFYRLPVEP
ncbi:MAG TPA: flavin reductase family protein [Chloroflexota bacterium]|jgi:flavin reductase (DIM6/NTAB) family NADH-FMN oxidoreductase RutF|nr:flavin reductase family protein [Chloroflexota bacterium]